jgi:glutamate-ammonia-ligase adenylyltransferase
MERLLRTDPADLDALRSAGWIVDDQVVAGELFDLIRLGPDPAGAMHRLGDLARAHPDLLGAALRDERIGLRLVSLIGGSRALSAAVIQASDPLGLLQQSGTSDPSVDDLARWVREALASVAAVDLAGEIDMPEAGFRVSAIADAATEIVVDGVLGDAGVRLAVIAMGKWGGRELNYASDIDLIFVHEGAESSAIAAATRIVAALSKRTDNGSAFRVDTDLRPEGVSGPLSRSLDSYRAYWERWAETWELQALLKARFVAGDADLGAAFLAASADFVFPEQLGADAVGSIRAMKQRTEDVLDSSVTELKRGVGGIRDVEFAVQLLQLVHGRGDSTLRTQGTLDALEALAAGGYVLPEDSAALADAYQWLRDAEHRIQLFDLRQTHAVPEGADERERLARAMGYRNTATESALEMFEVDLREKRSEVRSIYVRLFHRPVLDALAQSKAASMSATAAAQRLEAFGFLDTAATRQAVDDLTSGLSRRSSLMRHMLPLIMEWLSFAPDPDLGLAQLRLLFGETEDTSSIVATLRDDPVAAERLCMVLGTSRLVGRLLDRLPSLVPVFGDDAVLVAWPDSAELADEARSRAVVPDDPVAALHRFHAEHLLRIVVADIAGLIDEVEVGRRLSMLADATVQGSLLAASAELGVDPDLCVVAMGKWGGGELTYASDLDAIVVAAETADTDAAISVVERAISVLGGSATGFPSLELDLELRPEGRKGALVRSLGAFEAYWQQWVDTWELQAMLRARPAAGNLDLGGALTEASAEHVYSARPDREREIREVKARVETERIPVGEDPDFHLKLGRGSLADIEWTVQLLQMQQGLENPDVRGPGTLDAVRALHLAGVLDSEEHEILEEAYRFCITVRNRLYLLHGRRRDSLPDDPLEAVRLARSLGYPRSPRITLREDYRRLTRRARRVVEERFYGMTPGG